MVFLTKQKKIWIFVPVAGFFPLKDSKDVRQIVEYGKQMFSVSYYREKISMVHIKIDVCSLCGSILVLLFIKIDAIILQENLETPSEADW